MLCSKSREREELVRWRRASSSNRRRTVFSASRGKGSISPGSFSRSNSCSHPEPKSITSLYRCSRIPTIRGPRSEEHTSELQSLAYLVCRLLLEKKNKIASTTGIYDYKHLIAC